MLQSFLRSAIAAIVMVIGLSAGPSSAAIIYPEDYGLQVASGPVFTFTHPMIVIERNGQVLGTSHIYPVNTDVKRDGVVVGRETDFNISSFAFRTPSTYNFDIETYDSSDTKILWGSIGNPIAVRDSYIDRNAIEIIFQIDAWYNPMPGFHPSADYALMRMEITGLTGGFGGPFSTFSAIQKLEALASFAKPNLAIVDVDFTVTPLEDMPPPPPLSPPPLPATVPVPGSGLLILSALGIGAAWARRR